MVTFHLRTIGQGERPRPGHQKPAVLVAVCILNSRELSDRPNCPPRRETDTQR